MNYYNEFDPFAAAWLRELISAKLIPRGLVDDRSITEVKAEDLEGFTQCHFFAGIGGWPLALQLAGVSHRTPLWTGSPPCQPFSVAGKQLGQLDERHLAPTFMRLVAQCRPPVLFGEQVAAAIGKHWLDDLFTELERQGYACGSAVLPAASVGSPHKRDRLFFGATLRLGHATSPRQRTDETGEHCGTGQRLEGAEPRQHNQHRCADGRVGDTYNRSEHPLLRPAEDYSVEDFRRGQTSESRRYVAAGDKGESERVYGTATEPTNPHKSFWSNADWLGCRDGKFRPVEPGTFPLANGLPARVGRLRGYGNAIVPQAATEFIQAFMGAAIDAAKG